METSDQRDERLSDLQQRARDRREQETTEEREERLSDLQQRARDRREQETTEEREERLSDLQQRARDRREQETTEQREERLRNLQQGARDRRQMETAEERQERLHNLQERITVRRQHETTDAREERLQYLREHSQQSRQTSCTQHSTQSISKHQYLHEKGWIDTEQKPLHEQQWIKDAMHSFHQKQNKWEHRLCTVCHELWPTCTSLNTNPLHHICTRCLRDKKLPKKFSAANDMDPGQVPPCLTNLTQIEEMLIARACPIMSVYRRHGGQRGYKGHVLNLPQDLKGFLDRLPCNVADLPVLVVRRRGADNTHTDCRVRREKVLQALQWLMLNNPCYKDITINHVALNHLPEDGIPPELLSVDKDPQEDSDHPPDHTGIIIS